MTKFTEILTIAIPVFERKEFFKEAIESALNQTIRCEIIVVDNGSSHDYFENTCNKLGVSYYRNEKNIGMFPNWNKCFDLANTEFVMLLGDDDVLDINYVESFLNAKQKYDEIDIFFCDIELIDENSVPIQNHKHTFPYGFMADGKKVLEYGLKYRLGFPVISSAIKKVKFTGFYELFHASNDWVWLYENADKLAFYGEKTMLLNYRRHINNDSQNPNTLINCNLSFWYIYKNVLSQHIDNGNKALRRRLNKNINNTIIYIITHIEKDYFDILIKKENKYVEILAHEYRNNFFVWCVIQLPMNIKLFIYRIILKLRLFR